MRPVARVPLLFLVVAAAVLGSLARVAQRDLPSPARLNAETSPAPVTIAVVGDTILGNTPVLPAHPRRYLARVGAALASPDITFANLEGTLTTATRSKCSSGSTSCFAFRNPPRFAGYLRDAGIDVAGMANNHSRDFGVRGLEQTEAALTNHRVRHTGLPGEITVVRRGGVRVAFVAFAPYRWTAPLLKLDRAAQLIRRAVARADVVVVYMHAGAEGAGRQHVTGHEEYFLGEDRGNPERFAHMAIKSGADAVVASGPHVLRGMEFYRHRPVAYSLGNFAGYRNFNTDGVLSRSAVLRLTIGPRGRFVAGRIVSVHLSSTNRPSLDASGASALMIRKLGHADFGDRSPRVFADGHFVERN
jgi:poly-gamma-glutamate capsule biosynthesis protein CapA/YwtB (metallophosphatase superfamily)